MKTMCKVMRNFTIPILRIIEITVDFNEPKDKLLSFNYSTRKPFGFIDSCAIIIVIHIASYDNNIVVIIVLLFFNNNHKISNFVI